jgi:molybdopterin molybdotransferase
MITVSEAEAIIFRYLHKPALKLVQLKDCAGRVLGESVVADRDFPPFHRVSMDGIAIRYDRWLNGGRTFFIEGIQAAGEKQKRLIDPANCVEVMTGAILPAGCDAVVRYEDVEIASGYATVTVEMLSPWQSIHQRATDARKDDPLLEPGVVLRSSEVALLASVGKSHVYVFTPPRIAIVSTGDELVDIDQIPTEYQVRRSNSYALECALLELGADVKCFHLEDEPRSMESSLGAIIEKFDVLILSGGVSRGKFDFVPVVLENIGIRKLFHQVSQRPGKPFWFGRSDSGKVAFALPGNPVSTFMCYYRYIRPWILKSLGATPQETFAILAEDFSFPPRLTYFLQVSKVNDHGRLMVYPRPGGGSGDFANLKDVDGFLELPLEKSEFRAGEVYRYISFRH